LSKDPKVSESLLPVDWTYLEVLNGLLEIWEEDF